MRVRYVLPLALAAGAAIGALVVWQVAERRPPEVVEVEVEVPVAGAWIVLAVEQPFRPVGQALLIEGCITYTTPTGGSEETCRQIAFGSANDSVTYEAVQECWEQAQIGAPLPECWR